ncbi:MAG: hypothetical protein AB1521_03755 [Bacteroidota bacterium]
MIYQSDIINFNVNYGKRNSIRITRQTNAGQAWMKRILADLIRENPFNLRHPRSIFIFMIIVMKFILGTSL